MNSNKQKAKKHKLKLCSIEALIKYRRERDRLVEEWYIFRLDSSDESVSDQAALELAVIGTTRSLRPLPRARRTPSS